jgi:thiamine pyrophosphokinase
MITFVGPVSQDSPIYLKKELSSIKGLLIALDGGATLLHQLGIIPDLWFGDMDSADQATLQALACQKVKIFRYPTEKESSDFELALQYLLNQNISFHKLNLYGMLGGRMDHMLFNLELIKGIASQIDILCFCSSSLDVFLLSPKHVLSIQTRAGQLISLMPFIEEVKLERTAGLKYPLKNEVLKTFSSRGLSNVCTTSEVTIEIQTGTLLIFHYKEGFDENFS